MRKLYTAVSFALLFFVVFLSAGTKAYAQTPITANPAVGSFNITNMADVDVNANNLATGPIYKLKLTVSNLDLMQNIPPNTAYVRIGLGTRFILDPGYDLSTAPLKDYFTFTPFFTGSQWEIFCVLHTPFPADFIDEMVFQIKATSLGASTISGQWLINNANPSYILSDANPGNNSAFLVYNVTTTLPVTITKFTAVNRDCRVNLNWSAADELDFDRYEVEASTDGINFVKMTEVKAAGKSDYSSSFAIPASMQQSKLFVRLKNIDLDGKFKYSKVVAVPGTCSGAGQAAVYVYPNPVTNGDFITVAARQSQFDGAYRLMLVDQSGKVMQSKDLQLNSALSFRYDLGSQLAAGRYNLVIQAVDGSERQVVGFQKL